MMTQKFVKSMKKRLKNEKRKLSAQNPIGFAMAVDTSQRRDIVIVTATAIENIAEGVGNLTDLATLKFSLNVSMHLANAGLGHSELALMWDKLTQAHKKLLERAASTGRVVFDGAMITQFKLFLSFYNEQLQHCNYSMLRRAWHNAQKSIEH